MLRRTFLLSCLLAACGRESPPAFQTTDITGASFGRDFSLPDMHGQRRQLADFRGRVVVVFFGYVSCPDVCPTALSKLAGLMQALGADARRVQVLFVTVDPERDTPERLRQFLPWFHPDFLGLVGSPEETRATLAEFRAFAARQAVSGEMGYVMDHSAGMYVFDPAGQLRLFVSESLPQEALLADLRLLLPRSG